MAATEGIEQEVRARFPEGAVQQVVVLHYGDDPAIEPGRAGLRVVINPSAVQGGTEQGLQAFHTAHEASIKRLGHDLAGLLPGATRLELADGHNSLFLMQFGAPDERPSELTPVMARLGPADLETLDTLISAGIAPNRAEAVRWSLARIRERPAYTQLRERGREIEALKTQF